MNGFHETDKDGGVGPYVQSERQKQGIYMKYAKQLVEKGEAYYCFCDKERLESLHTMIGVKEISIYDKHCLGLSIFLSGMQNAFLTLFFILLASDRVAYST